MTYSQPRSTAVSPKRAPVLIAAAVVIGTIVGALGFQSWASSPAATRDARTRSVPSTETRQTGNDRHRHAPRSIAASDDDHQGALGNADGAVPAGVTVFDDDIPAVANLDPELLKALRRAATDAANDGVEFVVNSGWRSPEYQNRLLREAVAKYGSEEEAARWVATADTSQHVAGTAIDLGPKDAIPWLSEHGAAYGLCQIYRNEPWHYELRPEAIEHGCPAMYADPSQDPRLQK